MTSEATLQWLVKPLGEFAPLQYGKGLPTKKRDSSGSVPVFGSNGVTGFHSEAFVDGPGIVIGRKGSIGMVHRAPGPFWPIDTTFYVSSGEDRDLAFTYYLFKHLEPKLREMNSDSAVPGLNRDAAHTLGVRVPPLVEQRRIAWVLGSIDDKIEMDRRIAKTLEEIAAAIFKARFVDFVGVEEFEDSELGPIPKGWVIREIGDLLKVLGGATPRTKEPAFWNGQHYWATPKDLSGLHSPILLRTSRRITDEGLAKISSGLLPINTVLLSSRAPIGYTAITRISTAVNQGFIAIPPAEQLSPEFILFWIRENLDRIMSAAGGTTFAEISKKAFRPLLIAVPDPGALAEFTQVARRVMDQVTSLLQETETMTAIRDILLPKLISGEIRVPEGFGPDEAGDVAEELVDSVSDESAAATAVA